MVDITRGWIHVHDVSCLTFHNRNNLGSCKYLVSDVMIYSPRSTPHFTCNDTSLYCENINKIRCGTGENYQHNKLQADVYFETTYLRIVSHPASSPEVCKLRVTQLLLELCMDSALNLLGIWQPNWWRAGIRPTNLNIVIKYTVSSSVQGVFNYY